MYISIVLSSFYILLSQVGIFWLSLLVSTPRRYFFPLSLFTGYSFVCYSRSFAEIGCIYYFSVLTFSFFTPLCL